MTDSVPPAVPALFPAFLDLRDRPVLVVGGGTVARRKIEALLPTGAKVRVGAPALDADVAEWVASGQVTHLDGRFDPTWLDDVWLVIAATDEPETNRAVAEAAQMRRLWANVVDDAPLCSFQAHWSLVFSQSPLRGEGVSELVGPLSSVPSRTRVM